VSEQDRRAACPTWLHSVDRLAAIISCMIARHWRGWTRLGNAEAYEKLLAEKVLPGLRNIDGYRGGYIFRSDGLQESEFVVVNFFESMDAVKAFAGPNFTVPVFEPEAKQLLSRYEPLASHYQVKANSTLTQSQRDSIGDIPGR
jgi:hypothetical protein